MKKIKIINSKVIIYSSILLSLSSCKSTVKSGMYQKRSSRPIFSRGKILIDQNEMHQKIDLKNTPEINDLISYALFYNSKLRSYFELFKSSVQTIIKNTAWPDPMFSYSEFIEEIQTRTGPQARKFSLSQKFYPADKLDIKERIAIIKSEKLWIKVLKEKGKIIQDLKITVFDYQLNNERLKIADKALKFLNQLEPVIQRKYESGGSQIDVLSLHTEIAKAKNKIQNLKEKLGAIKSHLNSILNYREKEDYTVPIGDFSQDINVDKDELINEAIQNGYDINIIRKSIKEKEMMLHLTKKENWPDVTLAFNYFETDKYAGSNIKDGGKDPYNLTLSMNLPIERTKYRALKNEFKNKHDAEKLSLKHEIFAIESKIENTIFMFNSARRDIKLHEDLLITKAKQSLEIARTSYESGNTSIKDLMDYYFTLFDFENQHQTALFNCKRTLSQIQFLKGESNL